MEITTATVEAADIDSTTATGVLTVDFDELPEDADAETIEDILEGSEFQWEATILDNT